MSAPDEHRYVCDVLCSANRTANWEQARALYEQCQHIRQSATPRRLPSELRSALAKCLADLAVSYDGREDQFVAHALAVVAEVDDHETFDDKLFVSYYRDRVSAKDRFPALFETVVETSRRRRDAWGLAQALADTGTSGIMCGSMSYGPFYNVRGAHRGTLASDLDLLVVIDNADQLREITDLVLGLPGVDRMSVERFRTRADIFADQFDDGATVLSHKIALWTDKTDGLLAGTGLPADYQVSLHFLTRRTLSYVLVGSSTTLTRVTAGGVRTVRDYRGTHTRRGDLPRTFAGREHAVTPRTEAVDGGWLRWMTAYLFDETDCYCPGFLQTILLPAPNVLWDGLNVQSDIVAFTRKFYDRYRYERARNPNGLLRPSLTHVRRDVFAPHIIRQFDSDR